MRVVTTLLLLLTAMWAGEPSQLVNITALPGLPVSFTSMILHVNGAPVMVYHVVVEVYPMNTPPPWPIGLQRHEYFAADRWGQSNWCQWWFNKVAVDQRGAGKRVPYPFYQVNIPASDNQIETDEGIPIFTPGSVSCYEVENTFAP